MSLATAGLGGGGGGLSLAAAAHSIPRPNIQGPQIAARPPVLGVDGPKKPRSKGSNPIDKFPVISYDLYGTGEVVYCPPYNADEEKDLICLGRIGGSSTPSIYLKRSEASYKALKKLLTKGNSIEFYDRVLKECWVEKGDGDDILMIPEPNLLLGARRISEVDEVTLSKYEVVSNNEEENLVTVENSNLANAIEPLLPANKNSKHHVMIRDQTLDGSSEIKNDDFDRVAFQVHLHDKKKPLFLLPEDAVSILLAKIRKMVYQDLVTRYNLEDDDIINCYMDYPMSIPIPGWNLSDASAEAHLEAINIFSNTTHQEIQSHRCVSAFVGEMLSNLSEEKVEKGNFTKLYNIINNVMMKLQIEAEKRRKTGNDEGDAFDNDKLPFIHFIGVTSSGIEGLSVQVTSHDHYKCLSQTNYQCSDPFSKLETIMIELQSSVSKLLPNSNHTPCAVVTFGPVSQQIKMHTEIKTFIKQKNQSMLSPLEKTPLILSKEEVIACGAAYLASSKLRRLETIYRSIDIKYISNTAVGIVVSYPSDKKTKGNEDISNKMKIIFDYDRRIPAGPYNMEFSAAECVAMMECQEPSLHDIEKKYTNKKYIPQREKAAKKLKLQIFQQLQRGGKWIPIGNVMFPLTKKEDKKDLVKEQDNEEDNFDIIAIEKSTLELSLTSHGIIVVSMVRDLQTVVQAAKSLRRSTFQYYLLLLLSILFFGGFLIKSYWEEYIFERDTKRVLNYYKKVLPGSLHDGDEYHARFMVYKYGGKKHLLWKRLEKKYGEPVSETWDEDEEEKTEIEDEELTDLDENDKEASKKEKQQDEL